jgi:multidrug resistance efflux pump
MSSNGNATGKSLTDFARSLRRLQADEGRATLWTLACAGVVLAAWVCWAVLGRVSLYEISPDARIELEGATYPIDSPFAGQVVSTSLHVGRHVNRGDLLAELDATRERLQLGEGLVQLHGIEPQLSKLRLQIEAENRMRDEEQQSTHLSSAEAESRRREADTRATFAELDLTRLRTLHEEHFVSIHELEKAESDARQLRLAVSTLEAAGSRIPKDQAARERGRDEWVARLQGEVAALEAQRATLQASTERLSYEIERRRIRAPTDGRIGEAANLRIGTMVSEGSRLGSIVPTGNLVIVAQYPAQAALGRIRPGQPATLRLEGFPWTEFGTVSATVAAVAQEARDGKIRVELTLARKSSYRGSLEHGMPGTIEVTVERVSPLGLTLRTAGQWLSKPL